MKQNRETEPVLEQVCCNCGAEIQPGWDRLGFDGVYCVDCFVMGDVAKEVEEFEQGIATHGPDTIVFK
jgi:hypothetical protein